MSLSQWVLEGAGCSLAAFPWRAQYYYTNSTILVEDTISFEDSLSFMQNISAFPPCPHANWVYWTGDYKLEGGTSLELSYMRCSQNGVECISCEPTRVEWASVDFSEDCDTLFLKMEDGPVRTYFPAKRHPS